ncbi:MAG: hypothetical protein HOP07_01325 [Bacteriovoracaceae bacterium]|nr:hypothetical protein [Bacteriovoracaceae bacterium]
MTFSSFLIGVLLVPTAFAGIQSVKLGSDLKLNFDDTSWNYQYVKVLSTVTPHILENKKDKNLRVIIQKETHSEMVKDKKTLVTKKCEEANKFYRDSKQGSAKSIQIKNTSVCFIENNKKDKNSYQIIYPKHFSKSTYDLMSFAWQASDDKNLKEVSLLVGENL